MTTTHGRTALIGGLVADGYSIEPFPADVIIADGRIDAIVPAARRPAGGYPAEVVDCTGRVVAPGFVDIHTHSDISLLAYPGNASRVTQGITTEVVGNCGMSPAPGNADLTGLKKVVGVIDVTPTLPWSWTDVPGWLEALDAAPTATNVAAQVGHGSLRFSVAGMERRPLEADEVDALEREIHRALEAGVLGASVGLMYAPGESGTSEEFGRLAAIVARYDGVLSAHLRDYRPSSQYAAIAELADPVRRAGGRLQISHLRAVGGEEGFEGVLARIEDLQSDLDVAGDLYPYIHGHTGVLQLLPPRLRAAGPETVVEACRTDPKGVAAMLRMSGYSTEQIIVMKSVKTPEAVGRDLNAAEGDPFDYLVHLLLANDGLVDAAIESGRWTDVEAGFRRSWVSVASDGTALDASHRASAPHPRSWGAFSRGYRYLRDLGLPIGEVVRRMTTAPAARVGLSSGIARGLRADLVVIDDERFDSSATFGEPARPSDGLDHVFVNGAAVLSHGRQTGARPGVLIRRQAGG